MRCVLVPLCVVALGCGERRPRAAAVDAAAHERTDRMAPPRAAAVSPAAAAPLVVVTYNVLYRRPGSAGTLEALRRANADVALLQEITPRWERALREHLRDRYPYMRFHAARAGGLAVLSRWPLGEAELLPAPRWFPALRVPVEAPGGRLQVVAVHLRPPRFDRARPLQVLAETAAERRAQIEAYWKALAPELPTVIAGDFNESRTGDAVSFLTAHGLTSALAAIDPDATTWHDLTGSRAAWQLDHVMVDPAFTVAAAEVMRAGDSDHFPVVVKLERTGR